MDTFPHVYTSTSRGGPTDLLDLNCEGLTTTSVAAPPQFGGPSGHWSPEIFFSSAVSTCFILTFRAVSRAMKLEWEKILVDADAYLDKDSSGKLRFTKVEIFVTLTIYSPEKKEVALKALQKAEENCLINNSLNSQIELHPTIEIKN